MAWELLFLVTVQVDFGHHINRENGTGNAASSYVFDLVCLYFDQLKAAHSTSASYSHKIQKDWNIFHLSYLIARHLVGIISGPIGFLQVVLFPTSPFGSCNGAPIATDIESICLVTGHPLLPFEY